MRRIGKRREKNEGRCEKRGGRVGENEGIEEVG